MTEHLFAALAAALICVLLLWILKGTVMSPVKAGKNTVQTHVLCLYGKEPGLERNMRGLLWLNDNGLLRCRIVIIGTELDQETYFIARAFAEDYSCVTFIENGEMPDWIRKTN